MCTERKGHVRTQPEGSHLQFLLDIYLASTLILDFQPPELWEYKFLYLSLSVCGILFWQVLLTNTIYNADCLFSVFVCLVILQNKTPFHNSSDPLSLACDSQWSQSPSWEAKGWNSID